MGHYRYQGDEEGGIIVGAIVLPWWVASLSSNACIMFIEYINRGAVGGWHTVLPSTVLPIVAAQFCLFYAFRGAPTWLEAWAVFTIGNAAMRMTMVSITADHEVSNWLYTMAGVGFMLAGGAVLKMGLR